MLGFGSDLILLAVISLSEIMNLNICQKGSLYLLP